MQYNILILLDHIIIFMPYFRPIHQTGGIMGFKKMETNLSFTDVSLFSSMGHNQAVTRMEQINAIVDWSRIDNLMMKIVPSVKGTKATRPKLMIVLTYIY